MARKGPKVKDLARELGVTSRAVIDRCRAEGLRVQNSITRLDAETERLVRSWFATAPDTADAGDRRNSGP
ncbi:MAG TPA: translation initiation factor IF-2 N-terminal domain-containing protein [Phycisphaerae bacterium]|nr:translation initiation factor IF-2 N-terminal domain-containing protein [Phycisphaerae bacterium]